VREIDTEPGKWLLEEYSRTPGDPKWYPGMGLETTIIAIEIEATEMERTRLSRLGAEKTTPQKQADALRKWNPEIVAVIEEAERARIAEAVNRIPPGEFVRAAVLAIIEGKA